MDTKPKLAVVPGGPTQQDKEIDQCPGEKASLPVELHGYHITVGALRDLRLLRVERERHVGKYRQGSPQGLVEQYLSGRVREPILPADHVGDPVANIVHHVAEEIER